MVFNITLLVYYLNTICGKIWWRGKRPFTNFTPYIILQLILAQSISSFASTYPPIGSVNPFTSALSLQDFPTNNITQGTGNIFYVSQCSLDNTNFTFTDAHKKESMFLSMLQMEHLSIVIIS